VFLNFKHYFITTVYGVITEERDAIKHGENLVRCSNTADP
jgi:hypothetical protein